MSFSVPTTSRFKRKALLLLPILFVSLAAFSPFLLIQSGLNAPVANTPFLNGIFPTNTPGVGTGAWVTENAFPNLTFRDPIFMCQEPGSNRLFVAEKRGQIFAFDHDPTTTTTTLVMNIQGDVENAGENGLLNFAFHPSYPDSNYLYVFYQTQSNLSSRVSRFEIDPVTDVADVSSELILINQKDPANNHNGGSLFFDKDGYLFISFGDGGNQNNANDNGQYVNKNLLGGVLRIDVDRDASQSHAILRQPQAGGSYTGNYLIPNDNPFLSPSGNYLEEFYALGFRNPHRMTYDSLTNSVLIGDVGQSEREEVNLVVKGGNYQWSYKEGTLNGPDGIPTPANYFGTGTGPIYEYNQSGQQAIIGGYIYRGSAHPDIYGDYIFADYNSRKVWVMENPLGGSPTVTQLLTLVTNGSITSFAVDAAQELYILEIGNNGKIHRLTRQNAGSPEPPALLSQTGAFTDLSNMTPAGFMIPYSLNQPFWSDGAIKSRYLIVPNNGTHNTAAEQIAFSQTDAWDWPDGSILVKHFDYPMDETNPGVIRKLETRFMIKESGGNFYGITYRWRDDQTDADLLTTERVDTLSIATNNGPRTVEWYYPSRGDCMSCHNGNAGGSLGLRAGQQNGDQLYPSTGITANQLKTLTHLGMFSNPPDTTQLPTLPVFAPIDDLTYSLEDRARSYLDANCASCHFPGNVPAASFDTRFGTPLLDAGLLYGEVANDLGIHDSRVLVPGDADASVLFQRILAVHESYAMPGLAKNLRDTAGVQLIADWLNSVAPNVPGGSSNPLTYQRINFAAVPAVMATTDGPLTLSANASSGQPVTFDLVSGPATLAGNVLTLTGASGRIVIRAQQGGNGTYEAAPEKEQVIQVSPGGFSSGTGLAASYYDDINLSVLSFTQTDPQIDFYWGGGAPAAGMEHDSYSVKWEGEIEPLTSETYTFTARSDDGVRLWVNNQLVIDNWQDQSVMSVSGDISLNAFTRYPIRVEYYENGVYAQARLSWSTPTISREVIPSYAFYRTVNPILPVEWASFEATPQGSRVRLNWETLSERNAARFEVERSVDGQSFSKIGQVPAVGNSTELQAYQSFDATPLPGRNIYRLRQIDLNGQMSYSELREVWFELEEELFSVQVFPNPLSLSEDLQVIIENEQAEAVRLRLMDMQGRIQQQQDLAGAQRVQTQLSRQQLSAGVYILEIRTATQRTTRRVLIQ